jgi:UDP-N-acetylmuramoyl-tripeptide--D-alanyl-D-alanine ligase
MSPILLTAKQIAHWTDGTILREATGSGMQFDSRLIQENEWFVVLQGARDGHDFLPMAKAQNCAGAIGQHMPTGWTGGFVQVQDSLKAFQQISHGVRQEFRKPVVAITGSAGKTTTRALIASVLQGLGIVHQTNGNFNNHIGVPKTITDASGTEDAWVLEMGMSALGEIHDLQQIAEPDIRIITNVGAAHIEGCGSIEGVAQAKGELFAGARPKDICCINLDDHRIKELPIPIGVQELTYGKDDDADIRLCQSTIKDWTTHVILETPIGRIDATIPVPGEFMALNACAAVAVGIAAGVSQQDIVKGLEQYQPVGMRMRLETVGNIRIINDAYNANPLSMKAALNALVAQSTTIKVALLGDMLEMGSIEDAVHDDVLQYALGLNVAVGIVGPRFQKSWAAMRHNFPNQNLICTCDNSTQVLEHWSPPNHDVTILLKGSRGMRMENVLSTIQERSR